MKLYQFNCPSKVKAKDVFEFSKSNTNSINVCGIKDIIPFIEQNIKEQEKLVELIKALPEEVFVSDIRVLGEVYTLRYPALTTFKKILESEIQYFSKALDNGHTGVSYLKIKEETLENMNKFFSTSKKYDINDVKKKVEELLSIERYFDRS